MSYEDTRAEVLEDVRAYLDKIEAMPRNSFASHAGHIVPDINAHLRRLWNVAEEERTAEFTRDA